MPLLCDKLAPSQRHRLSRYCVTESVDIHCHCLPCLDDGPGTLAEALGLCRTLVADGITTVIATPHQLGRYDGSVAADDIRRAVAELNAALEAEGIPLSVLPGADVRLDERIPQLLDDDRILTLGDTGKYLLLELPHETFINPKALLQKLADRGITAVLSHPERNVFLARSPGAALTWLQEGGLLQVTAGSLLGQFGPAVAAAAWHWLDTGAAAFVATDAHDATERSPCITRAMEAIARRLGEAVAYRVCILNPLRVFAGKHIKPGGLRPSYGAAL